MSLEDAINENTKWLERVHAELLTLNNLTKDTSLLAKPANVSMPIAKAPEVKKEAEKPKAEPKGEKKAESVKEEVKGPSLSDLQQAITRVVKTMGTEEARAILKEFNAEKVSSLAPKDYKAFIEKCEAALAML